MVKDTEKIVLTGLFLAIGIILPPIFHSVELGNVISPMHFPVILCGLLLGWQYGLICGLLTPFVGFITWGRPPIMPIGLTMSLELATYGLLAGFIYKKVRLFTNNIYNLYFALIIAMVAGRIVYGAVNWVLFLLDLSKTDFRAFLTSVFVIGLPGIILQILILPVIVMTIEKRNEKD
ncbi:MAG TPA: ECF transporter S component [Bacilli bacterium]